MSEYLEFPTYRPGFNLPLITPKESDLRVYWIAQVPGKSFDWPVESPEEAKRILDLLAQYDLHLYHTRNRPDYSNAGGLLVLEDDGKGGLEWCDWADPETGETIDEWEPQEARTNDR